MSEKLSYNYIYNYFKDNGCELLESKYVNARTKMKYICKCGNVSEIIWNNFQQGKRCAVCSGNKKLTYEYVYNYFKENDCELLETQYSNAITNMKYKCRCGNISTITWNDFQQGKRCSKCSGNEKLTYEYVYNYFKNNGCELLEENYKNSNTNMKYKCSCENISYIRFNSFKKGARCMKCNGSIKYTYQYVKHYIESFGYKLLSENYINILSRIKVKCPNNHIYKISFNNFKNNKCRCKPCFYNNNIGKNHPNWKSDRTRLRRIKYLSFNLSNLNLLENDPNYINYITSKQEAKKSDDVWAKSEYAVDHIFPRVAFIDNDLDNIYGLDVIKEICNSRDNLRIITEKENLSKSGKYNKEEFMDWFNNKIKQFI